MQEMKGCANTMKKLIVSLLALAVLFTLAVPAMAASPVKDYASAKDGDLLYTVNFNGDEAFTPKTVTGFKYFDITPSTDGSAIEFKGNSFYDVDGSNYVAGDGKNQGSIWGAAITGLTADATTKYTMTYQIWMNETDGGANTYGGKNCYIGIGGMYEGTAKKWISFTSNYFTATAENRAFSLRRNSGVLEKGTENEKSGVFDAALTPVKDAEGYVTVRMTFDGTTGTVTAYILTKGTGANDSDWTKLIDAAYNVEANSSMAFAAYAQSASTHAKIKNVKYFKGLVTGVAASSTPETPVTPPAPTGDVFSALPVALLVLSGAAIAVVLKKKEN
jgi:hypothetical protein